MTRKMGILILNLLNIIRYNEKIKSIDRCRYTT